MIIVITESTETQEGQRYEITGLAEGIVNMLIGQKDRIANIDEGRVEFALWPTDTVEMYITELVAESVRRSKPAIDARTDLLSSRKPIIE